MPEENLNISSNGSHNLQKCRHLTELKNMEILSDIGYVAVANLLLWLSEQSDLTSELGSSTVRVKCSSC